MASDGPDDGSFHLVWILRFHLLLLPLGALAWSFRSWKAALAFAGGGAVSLLYWQLHRWTVTGLLTPSLRRRWVFAGLVMVKLALIALILRGMMVCFPREALPFVVGLLLFVGAILLEALRLALRPGAEDAE
jgi:hypothetical protein